METNSQIAVSVWVLSFFFYYSVTALAMAPAPKDCHLGPYWKTVDFFGNTYNTSAQPDGIAAYGDTLFAVGSNFVGNTDHWIVRRSSDAGETWTTVDDVPGTHATGVAVDPGGDAVYVAGTLGGENTGWIVRKSVDGGNNWATIDSFSGPQAQLAATRLTVDPQGNVSVIGYQFFSSGYFGVLRRSEDGGAHWTQINYSQNQQSYPLSVAAGPNGEVYIGGAYLNPSATNIFRQWTIWYSPDGKTGWQQVDSVAASPSGSITDSLPFHGITTSDGRVVFAGYSCTLGSFAKRRFPSPCIGPIWIHMRRSRRFSLPEPVPLASQSGVLVKLSFSGISRPRNWTEPSSGRH